MFINFPALLVPPRFVRSRVARVARLAVDYPHLPAVFPPPASTRAPRRLAAGRPLRPARPPPVAATVQRAPRRSRISMLRVLAQQVAVARAAPRARRPSAPRPSWLRARAPYAQRRGCMPSSAIAFAVRRSACLRHQARPARAAAPSPASTPQPAAVVSHASSTGIGDAPDRRAPAQAAPDPRRAAPARSAAAAADAPCSVHSRSIRPALPGRHPARGADPPKRPIIGTVSSRRAMPVRGEKRGTRLSPLSTTMRTPRTVTLDPRSVVASTIFRSPSSQAPMAWSCASGGIPP